MSNFDPKDVVKVVQDYTGYITTTCRRFYIAGGTPEDLFQEGVIGLLEACKNYRGESLFEPMFDVFAKIIFPSLSTVNASIFVLCAVFLKYSLSLYFFRNSFTASRTISFSKIESASRTEYFPSLIKSKSILQNLGRLYYGTNER